MGERLAVPKEWTLNAESEYRFELDPGTSLAIKVRHSLSQLLDWAEHSSQLVHGQAEIFGAELVEGKTYLFYEECKAAVFTWQGCRIEISIS